MKRLLIQTRARANASSSIEPTSLFISPISYATETPETRETANCRRLHLQLSTQYLRTVWLKSAYVCTSRCVPWGWGSRPRRFRVQARDCLGQGTTITDNHWLPAAVGRAWRHYQVLNLDKQTALRTCQYHSVQLTKSTYHRKRKTNTVRSTLLWKLWTTRAWKQNPDRTLT